MSDITWASAAAKTKAYDNGITDAVAAQVIHNNGPLNANGRVGVSEINKWLAEGWVVDEGSESYYFIARIGQSRVLAYSVFVLILVILDLYSKYVFRVNLYDFSFHYMFIENHFFIDKVVFNEGFSWAGFSYSENSDFLYYFLTTIGIISFTCFLFFDNLFENFVGIFLLSGNLGNAIEKIIYGNVTDFITLTSPITGNSIIFNIADIYIILTLTLYSLLTPNIFVKIWLLLFVIPTWVGTIGFVFYDIDMSETIQSIFS